MKVRRGGAGLHPRWGDFAALEGSKRWRNRLGGRGGARRGGTPLPLGLKLGRDFLGRGLLCHRALGCGAFGGSALLRGAFGGGSFVGGCALRSRTFGGALSRGTLRERPLRFRASLRGRPLGLGTLLGGALGGSLLRGGAELLLRAQLLGGVALLYRALHRGALLCRTPCFLCESLLRGAPLFLGAAFVLRPALRCRALFLGTTLGGLLLRGCALGGGSLGGRPFLRRSLLFVSTSLLGRESLLDRALEGCVLGGGALFLFGSALLCDAPLFRGALSRSTLVRGLGGSA